MMLIGGKKAGQIHERDNVSKKYPEATKPFASLYGKTSNQNDKADTYKRTQIAESRPTSLLPSPSPEMLRSKEFNAIWDCIKGWDIALPGEGYSTATGSHVKLILDAVKATEVQDKWWEDT